jgi:hypothetical protein
LNFGQLYGQAASAVTAATSEPKEEAKPDANEHKQPAQSEQTPPSGFVTYNIYGGTFTNQPIPYPIQTESGKEVSDRVGIATNIFLALFTGGLVWFAYKQTGIAVEQASISIKQGQILKEQADAAILQAQIAKDQLAMLHQTKDVAMITGAWSRKNTELQSRAYITVQLSAVEPLPFYIQVLEGGIFNFNLKVKNSGQTPATEIRYSGGALKVFDFPLPDGWNEIMPINHDIPGSYAVMGAGDFLEWHVGTGMFIPEIGAGRVGIKDPTGQNKRKELFAFGRVEYRDIFGQKRFTNFCYVLLPRAGDGALTPRVANKGNETDAEEEYRQNAQASG